MSGCCIVNIQIAQFDFARSSLSFNESGQSLIASGSQCFFLLCLTHFVLQTFLKDSLRRLKTRLRQHPFIHAEAQAIEKFLNCLARTFSVMAWLGTVVLCLRLLGSPESVIVLADWLLGISFAIAFGHILVQTLPLLITTLDTILVNTSTSGKNKLLYFYPEFRAFVPLLEQCLKLMICAGIAGLVFRYSPPFDVLAQYANQTAIAVFIYFVAQVAIEATKLTIDSGVSSRLSKDSISAAQINTAPMSAVQTRESDYQKLQTLSPLAKDACKYLIYLGAVVCVLTLFKVNVSPILASIGSLGVVFSLSVQNLVQDAVSGLIIIFDESYIVGDYIKAGRLEERPVEGTVEAIELRTTRLRHPSGQLQLIRNSAVGSVVNYSKQYAYATVDVVIDPGEDLEEAYALIEQTGRSLEQKYSEAVKEATQIKGLESLSKHRVVIRTATKVYPGQHQYVQRLLRQRLKTRFEQLDQERQDQAYAVQFNETGVKSLRTSQRSPKGQPMRRSEQASGRPAQASVSPENSLGTPESSAQQPSKKELRGRANVRSLFRRILSIFRVGRRR